MTDLERVELAARRVAAHYGASGSLEGPVLAKAFESFADQVLSLFREKTKEAA